MYYVRCVPHEVPSVSCGLLRVFQEGSGRPQGREVC